MNETRSLFRWRGMPCWRNFVLFGFISMLLISLCLPASGQVRAQAVCFTLVDRQSHSLSGVVNSYYPGVASAASGANQISLGPGRGSGQSIQVGDLLLVIQMQDGLFDSSNNVAYGDGGSSGSGYTDASNVGRYEYIVADSVVSFASGGSLTLRGEGSGQGLLNTYSHSNSESAHGQQRFQVVRVAAYLDIVLSGNLTASSWNGATGGVVAVEAVNMLDFSSSSINVTGQGFRGGSTRKLDGDGALSYEDYRTQSLLQANGAKGEGMVGAPRYVYFNGDLVDTAPPAGTDGYPEGSRARGAPGNAGGGGTDGNPLTNHENSGGGGGGNGGTGGQGGYSAYSSLDTGGRGGAAFAEADPGRLLLGGGGGSGVTDDGTGTPSGGLASSGAAGGGIVLLRAGTINQSGGVLPAQSISANGTSAGAVLNDGAGGGGAGGAVVVVVDVPDLMADLTISARGGNGGAAWSRVEDQAGNRHGPGGGGGGGTVFVNTNLYHADVSGGLNGTTTRSRVAYGAAPGAPGVLVTGVTSSAIPGVPAGFDCYSPTAVNLVDMSARSVEDSAYKILIGLLASTLLLGVIWSFFQRRFPGAAM